MRIAFAAALAAGFMAAAPAFANDYPNKAVRIFGQGAGSTADFVSRVVAKGLQDKFGQPFVIDNQAGAGGTLSATTVAKGPADGYTLVMGHAGPMVSAVSLYPNLGYDPARDFQPISLVATGAVALVVNADLPVNSAREFMDYVRNSTGKVHYSSAGNGSASHLAMEMMRLRNDLKLEHIPYRSAGPALNALLGGEVKASFLSAATASAQIQSGKVKALVVASNDRFPSLPTVPSAREAGVQGIADSALWFGLFAARNTPKEIVDRLNGAVVEILNRPDVREQFLTQGVLPTPSTPDQLGELVRQQLAVWTPFIRENKITAD
jgi:tripartite-type tricarboxylate transporter receptor subunit TctC